MIGQGRVAVNYRPLKDFNTRVVPGDIVTVDDEPIPVEEPTMVRPSPSPPSSLPPSGQVSVHRSHNTRVYVQVWKFFKPQACLSRMGSDQSGMKTVGELLEDRYGEWTQNLRLVGRLDFMTEGLMLLTNDGELKRVLELPSTGIERAYRARVRGHVEEHKLRRLAGGVQIQGVDYGSIIAKKDDPREGVLGSKPAAKDRANSWLLVSVWEGKNQEVGEAVHHVAQNPHYFFAQNPHYLILDPKT
jgi:pseudouridine synthase